MKKELFIKVVDKAENQIGSRVKGTVAKHLRDILVEQFDLLVSDRNISRYYEKYISGIDHPQNPKADLLRALSQYLEYENYEDFVIKNQDILYDDNSNKNLGTRIINQNGDKSIYIENNSGPLNNE